jgi:hypothetical protein
MTPKDKNSVRSSRRSIEKVLEEFNSKNFRHHCLAYLFTHEDFLGGTLGLAYVGNSGKGRGICSNHYNTGLVTMLSQGTIVSFALGLLTTAHEIGHSFGASHNNGNCKKEKLIIMSPRAYEDRPKIFSNCSKDQIQRVLKRANCLKGK